MIPQPSVGCVVHFIDNDGKECAAIVVHVWNATCVNLTWFTHNGVVSSACSVCYGDGNEPYHWHWPERTSS